MQIIHSCIYSVIYFFVGFFVFYNLFISYWLGLVCVLISCSLYTSRKTSFIHSFTSAIFFHSLITLVYLLIFLVCITNNAVLVDKN